MGVFGSGWKDLLPDLVNKPVRLIFNLSLAWVMRAMSAMVKSSDRPLFRGRT